MYKRQARYAGLVHRPGEEPFGAGRDEMLLGRHQQGMAHTPAAVPGTDLRGGRGLAGDVGVVQHRSLDCADDPAVQLGDEQPQTLRRGGGGNLPGDALRGGEPVRHHGPSEVGDGLGIGGAEVAHGKRHDGGRYAPVGRCAALFRVSGVRGAGVSGRFAAGHATASSRGARSPTRGTSRHGGRS